MTTSAFYDTFQRHDHGRGLKAHATHYCPGCGHGLVHKYLAEAIDALGVQDRTVAISPVGCAVLMYYYLDVGNSQAAHGRAPAVALGHKLANPNAIVVSYQGDGDLASIGLAEIFQAAQLGIPITVVFVNNAIYGMTGGQMAPTTLPGQKTTTSPDGRNRFMGAPMKVAEQIALLDGPVYVERVALYDAKRRVMAKKAIAKALALQVENKGFAFIEVLAECPTHLGMTPLEAENWVKGVMTRHFPLGVKKETTTDPWPPWRAPSFDPQAVAGLIGASGDVLPRFASAFPLGFGDEIGIKLAGSGGDGAQTAAMLLTLAAVHEGFDATHIPSYGPESRGGTSYADVRVAREEVHTPTAPDPDLLVAFNAPSLARFGPRVKPGGIIVYDSSVVQEVPQVAAGVRVIPVAASAIASDLGSAVVKNVVALGVLIGVVELFPEETFLTAIRAASGLKRALVPLNERAFSIGMTCARSFARASAT